MRCRISFKLRWPYFCVVLCFSKDAENSCQRVLGCDRRAGVLLLADKFTLPFPLHLVQHLECLLATQVNTHSFGLLKHLCLLTKSISFITWSLWTEIVNRHVQFSSTRVQSNAMLQDGVLDVNAICISETKTLLSAANCSCSLMRREITPCCDVRDVLLIELISAFIFALRACKLQSNNT